MTVAVATVVVAGGASLIPNDTVPTPPPPPAGTDWWISPVGNNTTCVRGNQAFPCASLNGVFQKATLQCGDEVEIASGSYGAQTISNNATVRSNCTASPIIFQESTVGSGATFSSITIPAPTSNLQIHDVAVPTVTGGYSVYVGSGSGGIGSRSINVGLYAVDMASFWIGYVNGVTLDGSDIGPGPSTTVTHPAIIEDGDYAPQNVFITDNYFHDFDDVASGGALHTECIFVVVADNVVIDGNIFTNCDSTGALSITEFNFGSPQGYCGGPTAVYGGVTIQNNWFFVGTPSPGADGGSGGEIHNDCQVLLRNNTFGPGMGPHFYGWNDVNVGNGCGPNTASGQYCTVEVYGNYGALDNCKTTPGTWTWRDNVWVNASPCHATDLQVSAFQVVNAASDLHLTTGSNAVGQGYASSFPALDYDGDSRPIGAAVDAGSDEKE